MKITAEDIIEKMPDYWQEGKAQYTEKDVKSAMIEFAKLHVEAALQAAADNAKLDCDEESDWNGISVDTNSILSAYPLTNIK
jgi:hypothetical protein